MDPAEKRKSIIVGIFLALGLILFILGVFTLGGQQKAFVKNIKLSAVFADVAGLKKGNAIWFSGVKVGTISNIKFIGPSEVQVYMNVDEATQQYIRRNAMAKIGSDGLIGNKIIVIEGGTAQAPVIEDGDVLQSEKMLSTDDMLKTLQDNNQNLLAITNDFKLLSHNILQGKGTVGALLADSTMAIQLRGAMRNLQATTQSTALMAVQLDKFSRKMNTKGGLADKMLTDTTTFAQIKQAVGQLQQTAANASTLTNNLTKASNKLNSTDNALGVLLNDQKAAVQTQSAINNLQAASIKLNDDLEAVQHNFFLRGFFKKKEKAKADSLKGK
ncbi:MCE family protein [Mucilaginibacter rubeus]|uniref:MCE family protein n=1 Tax=Mucilaginibacter rubeus TaxID=2027860 RepID=A0AAE6JAT2_9SPHI|nr:MULTISPECIES: MlaD family protein [Mucilaginibacter]QEM02141.1 MCE family protein [Mucilaginibacter rubeus]QEM14769.1 MCE family protein [Mucilaginibacter gossypii]QTE42524.1 MCE family protein [Mucilaginibacter rubeus]QTE49127.1 MCE family protein [Mucilaginibacter rubeus]QTE54225.1 MCE family protein [Mucilaginibacter rubeus]